MMIYIIIAAVIILLIYIALKRDAQIKEPKRLASKNQYIDTAASSSSDKSLFIKTLSRK